MSWKYVPFAGFFLFSLLITTIHAIVVPGETIATHLIWFTGRFLLLSGLWFAIRTIARFLDKRMPYTESFSRRVFFQIMSSLILLIPPAIIGFYLFGSYLPPFFSKEFKAMIWILLIAVIVLMNIGIAAGYFFSNWQKTNAEKLNAIEDRKNVEVELLRSKQRQAEMEMRALRAQMNPHFIFNSLNSINKYILTSDPVTASRYLTRFSSLIRRILDNSNNREIALSDELETLKLYIEMESLRFDNKFTYQLTVEENLPVDTLQIPPLIIQPFVENAIWHGLLHRDSGANLEVSVHKTADDMLQFIVEDNGIGRQRAMELKSKSANRNKSMGMKLTEDRITMMNQHNSLNGRIQIEDLSDESGAAKGTKVTLTIPI